MIHEPDKGKFTFFGKTVFHKGDVNKIIQIKDLIISAGADKHVIIWNIKDKQCIAKLKCLDEPSSLLNIDNNYVLLMTKEGSIYRYVLPWVNKSYQIT